MPEQPPVTSRLSRLRAWPALVPALVAFFAGLVLAGTTAHQHNAMSPYDEQAHFDYVVQLVDNHRLAPVGSAYDEHTLEEVSCRGINNPGGAIDVICPRTYQPEQVPPNGISYLLGYSPIFYSVLAALAWLTSTVSGISLFLAARFVVAFFFALGCATTVVALRRFGVNGTLAAALTVLMASAPAVVFQGGTVTPDGLALLVGSSGLLVATMDRSWRTRVTWATVLALVAAQVKISFLPVVAVTLLLAALWPPRAVREGEQPLRWPGRRALLRRSGLVAVAGLSIPATVLAVNEWRASTLVPGGTADGGMSATLAAGAGLTEEVIYASHLMLGPMTFFSHNTSNVLGLVYDAFQTLLVGGALLVALSSRLGLTSTLRLTALTAVLAWLATVILLPTAFYVMYDATGTQPRYSLPMLPLLLVPVAVSFGGGRVLKVGTAVLAAAVFGLSLWVSVQL